jgi:hypothetical protein
MGRSRLDRKQVDTKSDNKCCNLWIMSLFACPFLLALIMVPIHAALLWYGSPSKQPIFSETNHIYFKEIS